VDLLNPPRPIGVDLALEFHLSLSLEIHLPRNPAVAAHLRSLRFRFIYLDIIKKIKEKIYAHTIEFTRSGRGDGALRVLEAPAILTAG
jgi:hypothetical protein